MSYNNYSHLERDGRFPSGSTYNRERLLGPTESFSFIVDPSKDRTFTRNLRRKSLTGQAAHPISRQISEEKFSIPVEYDDEHERPSAFKKVAGPPKDASPPPRPRNVEIGRQAHSTPRVPTTSKTNAKRGTRVPVEHYDNVESDLASALNQFSVVQSSFRNKTDDSYGSKTKPYSPKKYEDQWSMESDPPKYESVISNKDIAIVTNKLPEPARTKESPSMSDVYEDHLQEIEAQDRYIKANYNLHRFLIIPDGNCLYRAVAQAVLLDQGQDAVLRQLTVDHIREHKEEFRDIIEGEVDEFLVAAQLDGEWAGYPEILAMSRWLDININITTGGTKSNPKVRTTLHYFPPADEKDKVSVNIPAPKGKTDGKFTERQSIWLSWLSSGHYDMLSDKEQENPKYEEWLRSRESRMKRDEEMATRISYEDANSRQRENSPIPSSNGNARVGANVQPVNINTNRNVTNSRTVKLAPIDSFLYRYRPSHAVAATNINEVLCSDSSEPPVAPHRYQPATQRQTPCRKSPIYDDDDDDLPPYEKSSTDRDEEIALALQREEDSLPPAYYA